MKTKLFAIILSALTLCVLGGFSSGGNGGSPEHPKPDVPGLIAAGNREALGRIYTAMFERGELSEEEYALAEKWDWIIPDEEKIPLDDFSIGEVSTGVVVP